MRQTSIDVYHHIMNNGALGKKQTEVYEILFHHGPLTASEIYNFHMKSSYIPQNGSANVCSALNTMREVGVVMEVATAECQVTGHTVILWDVTDRMPIKRKKRPTGKNTKAALLVAKEVLRRYASLQHPRLLDGSAAREALKEMSNHMKGEL